MIYGKAILQAASCVLIAWVLWHFVSARSTNQPTRHRHPDPD